MKYKKIGAIIALFLFFLISGCVSSIPDSVKHCYKSSNWIQKNISIPFINSNDDFQCIEEVAIREKNHRLCFYLNTSVDGICIQDYYEAVNDPTVCEKELGGMENCIHYYYLKETCHNPNDLNSECAYTYITRVNRPDFCLSLPNANECMTYYYTSKNDPQVCNQLWEEYAEACKQYFTRNNQNSP